MILTIDKLAGISLDIAGSFLWKINVTKESIEQGGAFVLRLYPTDAFGDNRRLGVEHPSRGFLIKMANSPSSGPNSSSTVPILPSTTSTATHGATPPASPSVSLTPKSNEKRSTNIGAIVGGVLGGIAIIVLCVIAVLLAKILRRRKESKAPGPYTLPSQGRHLWYAKEPTEIDGRQLPVEIGIDGK
jgi:hypothetical protein